MRQATCVEEVVKRTKGQEAVRANLGCVVDVVVQGDGEGQGDAGIAVIAMVACVGNARHNYSRAVGDGVILWHPAGGCGRWSNSGC